MFWPLVAATDNCSQPVWGIRNSSGTVTESLDRTCMEFDHTDTHGMPERILNERRSGSFRIEVKSIVAVSA